MKKSVKIIVGLCAAMSITSVVLFDEVTAACGTLGLKPNAPACMSACSASGCSFVTCDPVMGPPPGCICECDY